MNTSEIRVRVRVTSLYGVDGVEIVGIAIGKTLCVPTSANPTPTEKYLVSVARQALTIMIVSSDENDVSDELSNLTERR